MASADRQPPKRYLGWDAVRTFAEVVVDQMIAEGAKPKHILAVGHGGLIPASMIAYDWSKRVGYEPAMSCIYAKSYQGTDRRKVESTLCPADRRRFPGKTGSLLIVDDIADSGCTIQHFQRFFPLSIVATLITRDTSIVPPNFTGHKTMSEDWFVFPWEKSE